MADQIRFELGFLGGGAAAGTTDMTSWKEFETALTGTGEGVVTLPTDTGVLHLRVAQIAWARSTPQLARVGF